MPPTWSATEEEFNEKLRKSSIEIIGSMVLTAMEVPEGRSVPPPFFPTSTLVASIYGLNRGATLEEKADMLWRAVSGLS
jgi:hypothetical protein